MNEEPKSIWKKSWLIPHWLRAWLLVTAATFFVVVIISQFLPGGPRSASDWMIALVVFLAASAVIATIFLGVWSFIRWLCCWRNLRWALFWLVCFVTLIALFYAEEDWRGWHAWNQFEHEWAAKGKNFDYASIIPPPVPDDQNFALTPVIASCYETYFDTAGHELNPRNTNVVDRLSMLSWRDVSYENQRAKVPDSAGWQAAQKMDLTAWQAFFRSPPPPDSKLTNSFPVAPHPQRPADDVLLALGKYNSVMEEIRLASRLPDSRFPLTYNIKDKFSILLPHLAALKTSVKTVSLRSVAELQSGRTASAYNDARLSLYLANSIRTETFLISKLVRLVMLQTALQPVWEGLSEHRWSESQLIALDADLAKIDFLAECQEAQKSEIGFAAEEADYLRRRRNYAAQFAQMGINDRKGISFKFSIYRYMPGGWFYQSALRNGQALVQYFPAVNRETRTISPELVRRAEEHGLKAGFFDPLDSLKKMFNVDYLFMGNFLKKVALGQSSVDLARTAIALERYRLAHGEYPESLDALAPQFMAQVPHDVIGSGLLKYRREANGQFVLYSIGWNETDDGGVVVFKKGSLSEVDISKGDWVWRYPKK